MNESIRKRPSIAIIDPNTLAVLGLKHILQEVMPMAEIDTYGSLAELEANQSQHYFHYFAHFSIVLANMAFFSEQRHKTIVLSQSASDSNALAGFHHICINQPETLLIRSLLMLEQHAHPAGRNLPPMPLPKAENPLSTREIEVMRLIVEGCINKEIADKLGISLTTVITHRKNLMQKLGIRSVSALTIHAVMHGYVDINKI